MKFNMNTCWSRAMELLRSNFSLLIVIAGIFLMLPTVAIYMLMPDLQMLSDPTVDRSVVEARVGEIIGPIIGIALVSVLFQFVGQAAMVALMGAHRPTVGQALKTGLKALPALIVVLIVYIAVLLLGSILVTVPISILAGASGAGALAVIALVPLFLFAGWLAARLSMTLPALVFGTNLNPVKAIRQSLALTKKRQWQILLFWAVIYAVIAIVSLLLGGVMSVFAALLGGGTATALVIGLSNGIPGALTGMIVCAVAVAMYSQLSGPSAQAIEETFD